MVDELLTPLLESWPRALAAEFRSYWEQHDEPGSAPPFWLTLPETIYEMGRLGRPALRSDAMAHLLRGQLCLYFAIRILDDLLDGHAPPGRLSLLPSLFLLDAERCFELVHGLSTAFTSTYREALRNTLDGIVRVEELHRDPEAGVESLLEAYARVDSVLSVGMTAALELTGRRSEIPKMQIFSQEMGKASQILDDIYDMEEDLASGKVNVPLRIALGPVRDRVESPEAIRESYRGLLDASWKDKVEMVAEECFQRAEEAAAGLPFLPCDEYIAGYRVAIRHALTSPGQSEWGVQGVWHMIPGSAPGI
ncbi:MAG: class 1 isoprenoid biosynthesis enzyme [Bacteroidota bacterium]